MASERCSHAGLKYHKEHHHVDRGHHYTCALCLKTFDSSSKLNTHTAVHRRLSAPRCAHRPGQSVNYVKRFPCPLPGCSKVFTTTGGLQYHTQHGHSAKHKSIACPAVDCDKLFSSIGSLRTHFSTNPSHRPVPALVSSDHTITADDMDFMIGNHYDPLLSGPLEDDLLF